MQNLKLLITVKAGIVPGNPEPRLTKVFQWVNGGKELRREGDTLYVPHNANPKEVGPLYRKLCDDANAYARHLQDPKYLNWVTLEWLWL